MLLPYSGFAITANFNLCVKTDIFYKNCARIILWLECQKKIFFTAVVPHSLFHVISESILFPCDVKFQVGIYFLFTLFLVPRRHLGQSQAFADSDFGSWQRRHWLSTGRLLSFIHFFLPERCCWMQVSLFSLEVGAVVSTEKENVVARRDLGGGCRLKRWWKRAAGMGGEVIWVTRHASKACCGWLSRVPSLFLLFVFFYHPSLFFYVST